MFLRTVSLCIVSLLAGCAQMDRISFDDAWSKQENVRFYIDEQEPLLSSSGIYFCEDPGCSLSKIDDYFEKAAVIDIGSKEHVDKCFIRACIRYNVYIDDGSKLTLELRNHTYYEKYSEEKLWEILHKYFVPHDRVDDWYKASERQSYAPNGRPEFVLATNEYLKQSSNLSFSPIASYRQFTKYPGGPYVSLPYEEYGGMSFYIDDMPAISRYNGKFQSIVLENGESFFLNTNFNNSRYIVSLDEYNGMFEHPAYELLGKTLHPDGEVIIQEIALSDRNIFSVSHQMLVTDRFPPIKWVSYKNAMNDLKRIGKVSDYDQAIYDLTNVNVSEVQKGQIQIATVRNDDMGNMDFSPLLPLVIIEDGKPQLGHLVVYIGDQAAHYESIEITLNNKTYTINASNKWFESYVNTEGWPYIQEGFSFFGYLDHLELATNLEYVDLYFLGARRVKGRSVREGALDSSRSVISLYKNILSTKN